MLINDATSCVELHLVVGWPSRMGGRIRTEIRSRDGDEDGKDCHSSNLVLLLPFPFSSAANESAEGTEGCLLGRRGLP